MDEAEAALKLGDFRTALTTLWDEVDEASRRGDREQLEAIKTLAYEMKQASTAEYMRRAAVTLAEAAESAAADIREHQDELAGATGAEAEPVSASASALGTVDEEKPGFCEHCGAALGENAKFCAACGAEAKPTTATPDATATDQPSAPEPQVAQPPYWPPPPPPKPAAGAGAPSTSYSPPPQAEGSSGTWTPAPGGLRGVWHGYRTGLPRWVQWTIPIVLILAIIGLATSGSTKKPTSQAAETTTLATTANAQTTTANAQTTTQAPPPTTLTAAKLAQLVRDERAWISAQTLWIHKADYCLRPSSPVSACHGVGGIYTSWRALFTRATRDVRADSRVIAGSANPTVHTCKSRLLDYLGNGGTGDALAEAMGFAQKDALKLDLNGYVKDINLLVIPDTRAVVSKARAAGAACSP